MHRAPSKTPSISRTFLIPRAIARPRPKEPARPAVASTPATSREVVVLTVEIAGCVALIACTGAVLDVFDARTAIHAGAALAAVGGVTAFLNER